VSGALAARAGGRLAGLMELRRSGAFDGAIVRASYHPSPRRARAARRETGRREAMTMIDGRARDGGGDARTRIRVHAERAVPDEATEIFASGLVAHVGFVDEGEAVVIPMTYHYAADAPDRIHLHGAHHSRLMRHLAGGAPVCVTVTQVGGLVYSRTALYHSVNYRSVVCFARAVMEPPSCAGQRALLDAMIARYHPGRAPGRDYEAAPDAHLEGTALVTLAIEAWSAKARRGGPKGPHDADDGAPGSAGVMPVRELAAEREWV
jgi:nitroimidazol reductase NimA-like FMN-containing flavoprotein (pyridoxamine 5'-phosphate oxidase superfamily)